MIWPVDLFTFSFWWCTMGLKNGGVLLASHWSTLVAHYGLSGVFLLMVLESACIPIPSEAVVTYAGYLASQATLSFWSIVIVATLANLVGSLIAYVVGYYGGRPFILHLGRYIALNEKHLERAERWFKRRGEITVFITRLLPAMRTFISLPAGVGKMPIGRFIIYTILGSFPWNLGLTYAGFQLGSHWDAVTHVIKPITDIAAVLFVIGILWWWFGRRNRTKGSGAASR